MNKARVLIVEDEGIVASDLHYMVEEMGYIVAGVVRDGHAAIHSAETLLPDVVLIDITLPGSIDGIEAAQSIRTNLGIPVVFSTAHGDEETIRRAEGTTPHGFLLKPFSSVQLHTTLSWALRIRDLEHELRESNKWLSEILDDLDEAVIAADLQGKIRYLNQVAAQVTEWSSPETIGKDLTDVVHIISSRTNQSQVGDFLAAAREGRTIAFSEDFVCIARGGTRTPVDGQMTPIQDSHAQMTGFVLAFRDITDQKRSERVVRENERKFRTLAEATPAAILISEKSYFRYVNAAAEQITGYSREDLLTMEFTHLLDEETRRGFSERFSAWQEGNGEMLREEMKLVTRNGQERWVDVTITTIDLVGRVAALWTAFDITKRKHAQETVREQAALLEVTQDAIAVRDLDGLILYWNKGSERVYGWSREEALGGNIGPLLHKERSTEWIEAYRGVVEKGEWIGELRHVTKAGKQIYVQSRWSMMVGSDGSPRSILMVNTDITEKKQLEAQFRRAQRLEIIGTLAGGIAHDLNNVLAPISMSLSLLRKRLTDEKSTRILATVESSVHRGTDIVRQVLTFARGAEGDRLALQPKHVIREVEKITRETFPRSIELQSDLPRDLWKINGDGTQLHQVLMNLCVNARDAMPTGGILKLRAENVTFAADEARIHLDAHEGQYVMISVADSGTGIPLDIMEKIFDPFFTTKEVGKGTGLGLSTVLGIVKGHGGFVIVQSEESRGTEFRIYIPATDREELPENVEPILEPPVGRGEMILVVDDELSVREIAKETLEANGYEVLLARDGAEAIALFAQQRDRVRVVLTDLVMPYLDGSATIRALRKIDSRVKIIAASGLANRETLSEIRAETQALLHKPYTTETLLKTLDTVLR